MDVAHFKERCEAMGTNATRLASELGLNRNTPRRWQDGSMPLLHVAYAAAELLETTVTKLWPVPPRRVR